MKKKHAAVIGIILLLLIPVLCLCSGCASKSVENSIPQYDYDRSEDKSSGSEIAQIGDTEQPQNNNIEQKIIKNGSLTIETNNISQAEEEIVGLTEKYEGYINDSSLNAQSKKSYFYGSQGSSKNFEKFYSEIKKIGNVESFTNNNKRCNNRIYRPKSKIGNTGNSGKKISRNVQQSLNH